MKPPDNMITPKGTNITGKFRKCEEPDCEEYIMCPYVRCLKHWKAMRVDDSKIIVYNGSMRY